MTPWTVAHQASLSLGFHRQEYWSGLPCPSPGDLLNPGIKPRCPLLQAGPLLSEAQGKPKNIEFGNLSVLQGIFLTQELNPGLQHSRRILYHWAIREAPNNMIKTETCPLRYLTSVGRSLVAQSFLTFCDSVDCSPPGFSVHEISQARILEWVAISFSRGSSGSRDQNRSPELQVDSLPSEPLG